MTTPRESLRPYQEECLQAAKEKNIIVHLGTNLGKTLIAARFIENLLNTQREKLAVVLVPTQALVDQQAEYCFNQIKLSTIDSTPRVLKIVGNAQAGWEQNDWTEAMKKHHIFVGTPAVFQNALITQRYIHAEQFSVIVFDECHHARGNSPMASIMRDGVHPYYGMDPQSGKLPRILGLTASFDSGKNTDLVKVRRDLEGLLCATIVCPTLIGGQPQEVKHFARILYSSDGLHTERHVDCIEQLLDEALQTIGKSKLLKKAINWCIHVFRELGRESLLFYVEYNIVQQIEAKVAHFKSLKEEHATTAASQLSKSLPGLRKATASLATKLLKSSIISKTVPLQTPKLQRLLVLLEELFSTNGANNEYRGIIFVEQISLVPTMAKHINDTVNGVSCGVLAGTSAQTMSERQQNLEAFRRGGTQVLVATAAGEEGLDIKDCEFVILYSLCITTKSSIQRSGRARKNAKLYYFENDPDCENRKAASLVAVARDESLALTSAELAAQSNAMKVIIQSAHPFPAGNDPGGIVNVFNCKDILNKYSASVLGQSINVSEQLYDYTVVPGNSQRILTSIRYPTPTGWSSIDHSAMLDHWKDTDMTEVFLSSRTKNMSKAVREELKFVYIAVVMLRKTGLLDMNNKPPEAVKDLAKQSCSLRSTLPVGAIAMKRRVDFFDKETDKPLPVPVLSLENVTEFFRKYLQLMYYSPVDTFDKFFHYSTEPTLMPSVLNFPTPQGLREKTYDDFERTFAAMDLGDQLSTKSARERAEIGLIYLAVNELFELGYLDEQYQPNLTSAAVKTTRERCLTKGDLAGHEGTPGAAFAMNIPNEIDMSVAQVSEMSTDGTFVTQRFNAGQELMEVEPQTGTTRVEGGPMEEGGPGTIAAPDSAAVDDWNSAATMSVTSAVVNTGVTFNGYASGNLCSQFEDADDDFSL